MRILFLSDDFPPQSFGGAGISTYELALGMKRAGNEVSVITTCRKESEAGESSYHGLQVYKIVSDYPGAWRAYLGLYNPMVVCQVKKIFENLKPDVIHANNIHFYLSYYCLKLAQKYAKVVVFTARDAMSFSYGKLETRDYLDNFNAHLTWLDNFNQAKKRWNPFRNMIIRYFLRKYVNQIFTVSDALKRALEQNGIYGAETMSTGANLSEPSISMEKIANFKSKYNLEGQKVMFFAGRLNLSKGGSKIIDALIDINKKEPKVVLLVASPLDSYALAMKEQTEKLGLKVVFTGWIEQEEIKVAYATSSVVVVPSICFDAFPRMVLEAMAMAKPVVGTCYGGAPEIIVDGVTGYVVNPFNTKEMAEKILDLLQNPYKAENFGQAGFARVKAKFNLDDKINQIISYYQRLSE